MKKQWLSLQPKTIKYANPMRPRLLMAMAATISDHTPARRERCVASRSPPRNLTPYSFPIKPFPIPTQEADNALVTALGSRVSMGGDDDLLFSGGHRIDLKSKDKEKERLTVDLGVPTTGSLQKL
ncbi:hypothetical protein EVAR_53225_1 [Eumeta japonica]|uniref:Uncharacterized protein n=1 Tax=Eumeta variegata TaxID=151549 RepID=A0A4C1XDX5_EUMVA|nr:hypothetical protein EVAR_53225_1 [Eumeta japonica]